MSVSSLYDNKIVSGSLDNTVRIWNLNGICEAIYDYKHPIVFVSILSNYQIIAIELKDELIECYITFKEHFEKIIVLPNGKVVISNKEGDLKLIK